MKVSRVFPGGGVLVVIGWWMISAPLTVGAEFPLNGYRFTMADGMMIEQVAASPLVNRPISADFDEHGRLYVVDSSGSNDDVQIQLKTKPHRIVRLADTDGDGRFDESVVFADQMMFPEGTLWYDGSLYVGAPPHIWKLTDSDGDGRADRREEWFDGKTLTHCGNDMHGPFLGPDGWLYWCKGAFAEQKYEQPGRDPLVTRASHIFRRHPSGGVIESVMAGGMDNPVEVVFTPGGERIFTTTFLVHPGNGLRDGILHAIYGGVYGKEHDVLKGHPRTGPLMPVLAHHGGASAPCGLARLESAQLGEAYQNNLLACAFNMRKVIRHVLEPDGGSFRTRDSDFLVCDSLDFHPTDVLEDADGSVLVVDTGGWYKLCCPTSQLWKPDILGAIYRVRRAGAHQVADARGRGIDWSSLSNAALIELLADRRFTVRNRARQLLGRRGAAAVAELRRVLESSPDHQQRLDVVWSLTQIDDAGARASVRDALADADETVRQAALHSISLHRDADATDQLLKLLSGKSAPNRRAAAEALGRISSVASVPALLAAADDVTDRAVHHSLIYAVIETANPNSVHPFVEDQRPRVRRAALIALDQMPAGDLGAHAVGPLLGAGDPILSETAWWIAEHHPEWAGDLAGYFREELGRNDQIGTTWLNPLSQRLARFAQDPAVQQLLGEYLAEKATMREVRLAVIGAMHNSRLKTVPAAWTQPLSDQLGSNDAEVVSTTVAAVHALSDAKPDGTFVERLRAICVDEKLPAHVRLQALAATPGAQRNVDDARLAFLCGSLSVDQPVRDRSLAVDVLQSMPLNAEQLQRVAEALPDTGPMELRRLMETFAKSKAPPVGLKLVAALERSPAAVSLPVDQLQQQLAGFGDDVVHQADQLLSRLAAENKDKIEKLETILKLVAQGDVRSGQQVFHSSQAACINCHGMGYLGGRSGPDLTRIGNIRSERDLLESIVFPSVSLVRSYEPTQIVTTAGQVYNGLIREETATEVVLQLDAEKSVRIAHADVDVRQPGKLSIMPEGLEKHFTPQQLADLLVFLKAAK